MSRDQAQPLASFWQTIKMVAWSFLGIRRKSESALDVAHANPYYIVVIGIVGAVLLVAVLMVVVKWVAA